MRRSDESDSWRKIQERRGTARGEAVESIAEFAKHVTPTETIDTVPTDPDDNRALECAVSAGSQTIVTGDDDLLRLVAFRGIEIVTVTNFLTRFSRSGRVAPLAIFSADAVALTDPIGEPTIGGEVFARALTPPVG